MEKVNQKKFSRIKIMTILLLFSIFSSFIGRKEVYAAILDVEVLTNVETNNSSKTTIKNRWSPSYENTRYVDFEISGEGRVDVDLNVINGQRRGVLVFPTELVGNIDVLGEAELEIAALLNLTQIPLLANVLKAISSLLKIEIDLGLVKIDLTEFIEKVDLLYQVENLGVQQFSHPVELTQSYASVEIDNTLSVLLSSILIDRLTSVLEAAKKIKVEVRVPILGDLLGNLLSGAVNLVTSTLTTLLSALLNPDELQKLQKQLIDTAILGSTHIMIPTIVTRPNEISEDLDSRFIGTVSKESVINIDLLTKSDNETFIYFAPDIFEMAINFPEILDFGTHRIQTREPYQLPVIQEGSITLADTRKVPRNLTIGVTQTQVWQHENREHFLDEAALTIDLASPTGDSGGGNLVLPENQRVILSNLTLNQRVPILFVTKASDTVFLDLPSLAFQLEIPANSLQYTGTYQTSLTWTLSDGTTP